MDEFFKIIVYIIVANIAYLIFNLIKQGFKNYYNYIAELFTLMIAILWLLNKGFYSGWVLLASVVGILVLIILPVMLQGKIDSLMAESRYDEIKFFADIKAAIAWSNPNYHLKDMAEIANKYSENPSKMIEELKRLIGLGEPYDGMTRLFLGLVHFNSRNFNDLINDLRVPDKTFDQHSFEELLYLVRAYLETTRYDEAVEAQIALEKKIYENNDEKSERKDNAVINRFIFYAFMGWKEEYDDLLNSNKPGVDKLPLELKDFWRGVCFFYSGSYDDGEKQMRSVIDKIPEEYYIKEFMQKRMFGMLEHKDFFDKHVLSKLKELHEKYKTGLKELIVKNEKDNIEIKPQKTVTNALSFIILMVSVIYIVVFNVSDSVELINMGAVSSFFVKNGEYFRLISYVFVHIGFIHLIMNLFALKYFGPPIETLAGWGVLLAIFFGSGIAGGAASAYYGNTLTIGASGGVLGLLSAAIAFNLFKIKGSNSFSNQSNISNLLFIIAINIGYGFMEKGIDNRAHLGGLLAGFIMASIYAVILKSNELKKIVNGVSAIVTFGVIGWALYFHILGFNEKTFYPLKNIEYQLCDVASTSFRLEYPTSWTIEENSAKLQGIGLKGPFNEKLLVAVCLNTDSEKDFMKMYIDQRMNEYEKEDNFDLKSVTDPIKVEVRENTYKIIWNLKVYGNTVTWVDHIFFDKDLAFIVSFIVASSHLQGYDNIMEHVVSSLKMK